MGCFKTPLPMLSGRNADVASSIMKYCSNPAILIAVALDREDHRQMGDK